MRLFIARAYLRGPVIERHPIHLDGLLSWAVVNDRGWRGRDEFCPAHALHLPVLKLHAHLGPENKESWIFCCSSAIWPTEAVPTPIAFTKRADGDTLRDRSWSRSEGPQRDHFVKQSGILSPHVDFMAYGHMETVGELLSKHVSHFGALRRLGYGSVDRWEVDAVERGGAFDAVVSPWGLARRSIPAVLLKDPKGCELLNCRPDYFIREKAESAVMRGCPAKLKEEVVKTWTRQVEDPTRRANTRRQNRSRPAWRERHEVHMRKVEEARALRRR